MRKAPFDFEKAFWKLEPDLSEDNRELAGTTLRSIALNYTERKTPTPPRAMVGAIGQLKKRNDIIITLPDNGSVVAVMDMSDYVRLRKESSINDEGKFKPVRTERPNLRGRPPKPFHPPLEKDKELTAAVKRILPKDIADCSKVQDSPICVVYQRLTKKQLAMRHILSATGTYNYTYSKMVG